MEISIPPYQQPCTFLQKPILSSRRHSSRCAMHACDNLSNRRRAGIDALRPFAIGSRLSCGLILFPCITPAVHNLRSRLDCIDTLLAKHKFPSNTANKIEGDFIVLAHAYRWIPATSSSTTPFGVDHHGALRCRVTAKRRVVTTKTW